MDPPRRQDTRGPFDASPLSLIDDLSRDLARKYCRSSVICGCIISEKCVREVRKQLFCSILSSSIHAPAGVPPGRRPFIDRLTPWEQAVVLVSDLRAQGRISLASRLDVKVEELKQNSDGESCQACFQLLRHLSDLSPTKTLTGGFPFKLELHTTRPLEYTPVYPKHDRESFQSIPWIKPFDYPAVVPVGIGTASLRFSRILKKGIDDEFLKVTAHSLYGALVSSKTSTLDFKFKLPPLPLDSQRFPLQFKVYHHPNENQLEESSGVDCSTESEIDRGTSVWDEALRHEPTVAGCWEHLLGVIDESFELPFLSHAGSDTFLVYCSLRETALQAHDGRIQACKLVSKQHLVRSALLLLVGVPSEVYIQDEAGLFHLSPNVMAEGMSLTCLHNASISLMQAGADFLHLRKFLDYHLAPSGLCSTGSIFQAFLSSLRAYLMLYQQSVLVFSEEKDLTLLALNISISVSLQQLSFLARICEQDMHTEGLGDSPWSAFPQDTRLVAYLYCLLKENAESKHYPLLLYLFKETSIAYIRFIHKWLFYGTCSDEKNEFFICSEPRHLFCRDETFWTSAFVLRKHGNSLTSDLFLTELDEDILICGKSIQLLRNTCPTHHIIEPVSPPPLRICFSVEDLLSVRESWMQYQQTVDQRSCSRRDTLFDDGVFDHHVESLPSLDNALPDKRPGKDLSTLKFPLQGVPLPVVCGTCLQTEVDESGFENGLWKSPLSGIIDIIDRSLRLQVLIQTRLVNKATLDYFFLDLQIGTYFKVIRNFFLLKDGLFGWELASLLFGRNNQVGSRSSMKATFSLNRMLSEAMKVASHSKTCPIFQSLRLSLSEPNFKGMKNADRDVEVCTKLHLRIMNPWPVNVVITRGSVSSFNKVFSFLMLLNRAQIALQEVRLILKTAGQQRTSPSPKVYPLIMFQFETKHFLNNLQNYLVVIIVEHCWDRFQVDLKKVENLEQLRRSHEDYVLRVLELSMLNKENHTVMEVITDLLTTIINVSDRAAITLQSQTRIFSPADPSQCDVKAATESFNQRLRFLLNVVRRLVERSHRPHLELLLLSMNFNGFYG